MQESELFQPICDYFREQGFEIQGEVRGCDVVARRDDDLVAVELKLRPNLELVLQTSERLSVFDHVYAAIPAGSASSKHMKRLVRLWKQLGVGLFLIHLTKTGTRVELAVPARGWEKRRRKTERQRVLKEVKLRRVGPGTGGVSGRKLLTAYRENALEAALLLGRFGPASPRALRGYGAGPKTGSILYANYYGWFIREGKGVYALSEDGHRALREFREVVAVLSRELGLE